MAEELTSPYPIRDQLTRMLASKRFKAAMNQSDFLKLVVERALEGKKTPGHILAKKLFPDKPSYYVRVTADNLRKTLKRYNAEEGKDDPIFISLPEPPGDPKVKFAEGEAYTPSFSINPRHSIYKEFALAEFHRLRGTVHDGFEALKHYDKVRDIIPTHVDASLGEAEVWIQFALWDSLWGLDIGYSIHNAAEVLDIISKVAGPHWRLYAAAGHMLTIDRKLDHADKAIREALKFNRAKMEDYHGYVHFLIATGRIDQGLHFAARQFEANIGEVLSHLRYAHALMAAGQIEKSLSCLQNAAAMEPGHSQVNLDLAQIYFQLRRPEEALGHLKVACFLVDEYTLNAVAWRCWQLSLLWPEEVQREWKERPFPALE